MPAFSFPARRFERDGSWFVQVDLSEGTWESDPYESAEQADTVLNTIAKRAAAAQEAQE